MHSNASHCPTHKKLIDRDARHVSHHSQPLASHFHRAAEQIPRICPSGKIARRRKKIVKDYTNKYHDARHVCWAYMLGADRTRFLSSDNGEPSGTAGKPILGQINSFELTDIIIVVVRYFGGIKLGTSGLISAYREASRLALDEADIIECHEQTIITFTYPYIAMNDVMKAIKSSDIKILSQDFNNTCRISLSIRSDYAEALASTLAGISGVSIN